MSCLEHGSICLLLQETHNNNSWLAVGFVCSWAGCGDRLLHTLEQAGHLPEEGPASA